MKASDFRKLAAKPNMTSGDVESARPRLMAGGPLAAVGDSGVWICNPERPRGGSVNVPDSAARKLRDWLAETYPRDED